jgi:hypothetical protein
MVLATVVSWARAERLTPEKYQNGGQRQANPRLLGEYEWVLLQFGPQDHGLADQKAMTLRSWECALTALRLSRKGRRQPQGLDGRANLGVTQQFP